MATVDKDDAGEFYTKIIVPLAEQTGQRLTVNRVLSCIDCGHTSKLTEHHVQSISLDIPQKPGVSLTSYDLLKEYFEHDIREKCSHCCGIASIKQSLSSIAQTLSCY